MKKKIAIIANGQLNDAEFHKNLLNDSDIVICADGGANHAHALGVTPDYIIGDLDSIKATVLTHFIQQNNTTIIKDKNEDKTDVELALSLAESFGPSEIRLLGAIGSRIDHTLANILCLTQVPSNIKTQVVDDKNIIELVENTIDLDGKKDDIVSVVPLTDILGLTYTGMKWPVSNKNTSLGWFAVSNRMKEKRANITLSKGKLLVIRARD